MYGLLDLTKKLILGGGNALNLKEEFKVYGLPKWFMYLIGFLKLSFALILILGIWFKSISICYLWDDNFNDRCNTNAFESQRSI